MSRRPVRRTIRPKKKDGTKWGRIIFALIVVLFVLGIWHYRDGLAYYFSFKTHKQLKEEARTQKVSDIRNFQIMHRHAGMLIGVDVSEYQGRIVWQKVKNVDDVFPITFAFVRATAGSDRPDSYFAENWAGAKKANIVRGAYHYYRPDENSLQQAQLFIKTVHLRKGDLPPVLDIEKLPAGQSLDSLKIGLQRWLNKVETYYGVKPIIYTGEKYYKDFLKQDFGDYPFWIANYNFTVEKIDEDWLFWQFTERSVIDGIKGKTDVNIFNGGKRELRYLTVGN